MTENPQSRVAVWIHGTADWNQPIATNQHYMARELSQDFEVTFTESIGLRRPKLRRRDAARIIGRLRTGGAADSNQRAIPAGLSVRSPRAIPLHTGIARKFNDRVVRHVMKDWLATSTPRLLWTYSPLVYAAERRSQPIVYHCVDLLGQVEGISAKLIQNNEVKLANSGAIAIASSPVVREHLREIGFDDIRLWPNVADTSAIEHREPRPPRQRRAGRVVFAGNITPGKVDFSLLRAVLEAGLELHLAGPSNEWAGAGGRRALDQLEQLGATYHGMLSFEELTDLYWTATVGIIPYALNNYTVGVSPLKTYEYLAAGMSVVSVNLPSVLPLANCVTIANSSEFAEAVRFLAWNMPDASLVAARQSVARHHSWARRGADARELVKLLVER